MTKLDAGLITSLPASDPGSAAVWGSKRINPRPQFCLCLAWSGCPSNDDDDDEDEYGLYIYRESNGKLQVFCYDFIFSNTILSISRVQNHYKICSIFIIIRLNSSQDPKILPV